MNAETEELRARVRHLESEQERKKRDRELLIVSALWGLIGAAALMAIKKK